MAAPQLEVIISANIAALEKSLDTAEKAIENLNREAGDTDGLDKLKESFKNLEGASEVVKTELIESGKATNTLVGKFKKGTETAGQLATAFSGLEGAAGEAAGAIGGVLSGFAAGGLAGAALTFIDQLIDKWDTLLLVVGDVGAKLRLQQQVEEGAVNRRESELEIARATLNVTKELADQRIAAAKRAGASEKELAEIQKQNALDLAADQRNIISGVELLQKAQEEYKGVLEGLQDIAAAEGEAENYDRLTVAINKQEAAINISTAALIKQKGVLEDILFVEEKRAAPGRPTAVGAEVNPAGVKLQKFDPTTIVAPVQIELIPQGLTDEEIAEKLALIDLNNQINDLVDNTIAGTIGQLGENIGAALVTGANIIETVGATVLQAFAGFLSELGDQLIAYGTAALAIDALNKVIGTATGGLAAGAAIAAGFALKTFGGAFKAAGQAGFGGAGNVGGGGLQGRGVGGGVGGGSLPAGNTGGPFNGAQTVIFEIEGTKLVGVLERTLDRSRRLNSTTIF